MDAYVSGQSPTALDLLQSQEPRRYFQLPKAYAIGNWNMLCATQLNGYLLQAFHLRPVDGLELRNFLLLKFLGVGVRSVLYIGIT